MNVHGRSLTSGGEFTLCGMAFDAHESGDADEPVVFAHQGQIITCPDCRTIINYVKTFKHYRQPGE